MSIRTFVAIEIDECVRQELGRVQSVLRDVPARVKWVKPRNIHLTLVFLGDIAETAVRDVTETMDKTASELPRFAYEVAGIGFFGPPRSPRIIWAGAKGNLQPLKDLHGFLTLELIERGFSLSDKPFTPHLTIARIRSTKNSEELINALRRTEERSFGRVAVRRVVLFRSDLQPTGPEYTVVHESALAPN